MLKIWCSVLCTLSFINILLFSYRFQLLSNFRSIILEIYSCHSNILFFSVHCTNFSFLLLFVVGSNTKCIVLLCQINILVDQVPFDQLIVFASVPPPTVKVCYENYIGIGYFYIYLIASLLLYTESVNVITPSCPTVKKVCF